MTKFRKDFVKEVGYNFQAKDTREHSISGVNRNKDNHRTKSVKDQNNFQEEADVEDAHYQMVRIQQNLKAMQI